MIGRRGLVLLGSAAAVTLATALLLAPDDTPLAPASSPAFPGLADALSRLNRIELRRHDAALSLLRDGDDWGIAEHFGHPAEPSRVAALVTALTEVRLLEPRLAEARTGTDDPLRAPATGTLLRLLDAGGGALAELIVGTRRSRPGEETALVRRPSEPGAWLAESRLVLDADPQLWLAREVADLPAQRLRRVEVRRAGEPALVLERPGEVDAPLVIVEPRDPLRPDGVALDAVGKLFEGLGLRDVRPAADEHGEALGETRFLFTDGLAITARTRRDEDVLWTTLRAEGDAEAAALNRRWARWRYALDTSGEPQLLPRLQDLLERR
jgi:hypothetical protein